MVKRIGAEAVLALHFGVVAFAVLGGFLALVDLRWLWLHVPVVAWSSLVNLAGWTCPLTPLEQSLRRGAGLAGYEGGFVSHYIGPVVYPRGMPRQLELTAAVSVVVWNAIVYAAVYTIQRG
jgi:hypothetical protein